MNYSGAQMTAPRYPWHPTEDDYDMTLPDIEVVSAKVHEAWMDSKRAQGVSTRKAEDGEELMVPYADLTEKAKELDRGTVRAVFDAIRALENRQRTDGEGN